MRKPPLHRQGFTFTELLVAIAVAGLLIAFFISGIERAKTAARGPQCRYYLKQLGLGLHLYHDNHKVLPPGIAVPADPMGAACDFVARSAVCDRPELARISGLTMLLPYMEEKAAYENYNRRLACCAPENNTSVSTVVKVLLCPSNPRAVMDPIRWGYYASSNSPGLPHGPASTDYVFNAGAVGLPVCGSPSNGKAMLPPQFVRAAGPFGVNSSVRFGDLKDGLSNTIMMGESAGGRQLTPGAEATRRVAGGAAKLVAGSSTAAVDQPWSQGYLGTRTGLGGFGSVFAATAFNAWYTPNGELAPAGKWFAIPINENFPKSARATWAMDSLPGFGAEPDGAALEGSHGSMQGFRSYHPQIAQVVWGDGSVRVLTQKMSPEVLVAASTFAGGEKFDPPPAE